MLKKLQQDLKDKNQELSQLKIQLKEEMVSSEKIEDVLLKFQIDNDMLKGDYKEHVTVSKAYQEKHVSMQQKGK